jgi:hypothetical protein
MLVVRASPASQIPSSKTGSYYCTNPKCAGAQEKESGSRAHHRAQRPTGDAMAHFGLQRGNWKLSGLWTNRSMISRAS